MRKREGKSERADQWKTRYTRGRARGVCVYSNASTQHKRSHRPGAFVISDLPRDQYDVDFTVVAQPRPTGIYPDSAGAAVAPFLYTRVRAPLVRLRTSYTRVYATKDRATRAPKTIRAVRVRVEKNGRA